LSEEATQKAGRHSVFNSVQYAHIYEQYFWRKCQSLSTPLDYLRALSSEPHGWTTRVP
jgi:hypothetical protein